MRPDVGSTRRLTILRVVVLPQPDGPMSTASSPSPISRERSSTAQRLAYRLLTDCSRSIVRGYSRPMLAPEVLAASTEPWVRWDWVSQHTGLIAHDFNEHLVLTGLAVGIGLLIATPLALLARRWRWLQAPLL